MIAEVRPPVISACCKDSFSVVNSGLLNYHRLGAPSVSSSTFCRFASRGVSKVGQSRVLREKVSGTASRYNNEMSDEELGLEDVEAKLQALVDDERKRQMTVKYHMLRRKMTPSGAPQRKLTWNAIEQIRYLKQEQPDEWTVERLAEGFSVTPDVILRVLRSKFVPNLNRKAKQDAKVFAGLGQQVLPSGAGTVQDRLKLPRNNTQALLPPGRRDGAVPLADQTLMPRGEGLGSLTKSSAALPVLHTQFTFDNSIDAPVTIVREEDRTTSTNPTVEDRTEEESWDGQVLTEEELEKYMEMEKPPPVVQVGKDFCDTEGNFLYRI